MLGRVEVSAFSRWPEEPPWESESWKVRPVGLEQREAGEPPLGAASQGFWRRT